MLTISSCLLVSSLSNSLDADQAQPFVDPIWIQTDTESILEIFFEKVDFKEKNQHCMHKELAF